MRCIFELVLPVLFPTMITVTLRRLPPKKKQNVTTIIKPKWFLYAIVSRFFTPLGLNVFSWDSQSNYNYVNLNKGRNRLTFHYSRFSLSFFKLFDNLFELSTKMSDPWQMSFCLSTNFFWEAANQRFITLTDIAAGGCLDDDALCGQKTPSLHNSG